MNTRKTNLILVSLIVLTVAASLILLPLLPDQVASHWNAQGKVDDYMSKTWGTFIFPIILIILYLLYTFIPKIDPLKNNIDSFRTHYNMLWVIISLFVVYIFGVVMAWNLGFHVDIKYFMAPGLALLWYAIAVLLGKTKRNWFVGIRTPWTLSSDVVWEKTHKLGSKLFKAAAILALISIFFGGDSIIFLIVVPAIAASLIAVIYSFIEYRRQTN